MKLHPIFMSCSCRPRKSRFYWLAASIFVVHLAAAAALPARTTLSDPSIRFTVPDKPYAVLRSGALEAVVVDNRAVNDDVLPGHRAGYHGVASLKHAKQSRNLFVPAYAGLNFEHIHDGTVQTNKVLFEPRNAPIELRSIDSKTAELYQPPTPHWGLESCMRYRLIGDEMIEMTFECIPRRDSYKHGYIGLFWASYIDQPESRDVHFLAPSNRQNDEPTWVRASSSAHGVLATHRAAGDRREFPHDPAFPLTLVFNYSDYRYAEPWFYGVSRGMAFIQVFRPGDNVRMSQSPSGGGNGNPAWDFQWFIPEYKVGQRYQLVMRAIYTVHEVNPNNPFESQDHLLAAIKRASRFDLVIASNRPSQPPANASGSGVAVISSTERGALDKVAAVEVFHISSIACC